MVKRDKPMTVSDEPMTVSDEPMTVSDEDWRYDFDERDYFLELLIKQSDKQQISGENYRDGRKYAESFTPQVNLMAMINEANMNADTDASKIRIVKSAFSDFSRSFGRNPYLYNNYRYDNLKDFKDGIRRTDNSVFVSEEDMSLIRKAAGDNNIRTGRGKYGTDTIYAVKARFSVNYDGVLHLADAQPSDFYDKNTPLTSDVFEKQEQLQRYALSNNFVAAYDSVAEWYPSKVEKSVDKKSIGSDEKNNFVELLIKQSDKQRNNEYWKGLTPQVNLMAMISEANMNANADAAKINIAQSALSEFGKNPYLRDSDFNDRNGVARTGHGVFVSEEDMCLIQKAASDNNNIGTYDGKYSTDTIYAVKARFSVDGSILRLYDVQPSDFYDKNTSFASGAFEKQERLQRYVLNNDWAAAYDSVAGWYPSKMGESVSDKKVNHAINSKRFDSPISVAEEKTEENTKGFDE